MGDYDGWLGRRAMIAVSNEGLLWRAIIGGYDGGYN
jgi:hypothetical protein